MLAKPWVKLNSIVLIVLMNALKSSSILLAAVLQAANQRLSGCVLLAFFLEIAVVFGLSREEKAFDQLDAICCPRYP